MSAKKCCVPGCTDSEYKKHRFPKSEPKIFYQWLTNINNKKLLDLDQETIYKLYRVCDRHFSEYFIVQGTKRGLKRLAIPTLYLPENDVSGKSRTCCVPGCKNRQGKRHRFPKKEPEVFNSWINRIRPNNYEGLTTEEIYQKYVICEEHFTSDCIVPGRRGLKRTAVPSLNIPGFQSTGTRESVIPEKCTKIVLKEPQEVGSFRWLENPSDKGRVVSTRPSTLISSDLKESRQATGHKFTANSLTTSRRIEDDRNSITNVENFDTHTREGIKLECYSDDDDEQFLIKDEDEQDIARDKESTTNSDLTLRKEMFKQFVIQIIDEITNEQDLNTLKQLFAKGVPRPSHIQENVKK